MLMHIWRPQKQGNKKLEVGIKAKNRFLLREAIGLYGQGLALGSSESEVNVALLNNRAHVHSMLGEPDVFVFKVLGLLPGGDVIGAAAVTAAPVC
jgi:hypothetical protein